MDTSSISPYIFKILLALFLSVSTAHLQNLQAQNIGTSEIIEPGINAVKISGEISIDGRLDEALWELHAGFTGFTQRYPNPGEIATFPTIVKVLYDDNYLYVGMRMYDDQPDLIEANLGRKDDMRLHADWAHVIIDSNNDGRTAYRFYVNAAGVRRDGLYINDNMMDNNWSGVWEAAANIDSEGWTAEIKIPFSQLGISINSFEPFNLGVNFGRSIARLGEGSFWAPIDPQSGRFVSHSRLLSGLNLNSSLKGMEFVSYMVSGLEHNPRDDSNPLVSSPSTNLNAGIDMRYSLSHGITLNATINPDFGQVEVDPAIVNLSAFQNFFPERRPFFTDQSSIFNFGQRRGSFRYLGTSNMQGNMQLFYSRRIGRSPQGGVPSGTLYSDTPSNTRILGAVKIAGRTTGGWSLGVMNSLTERMVGKAETSDGRFSFTSEPLTNYSIVRIAKDLRGNANTIGFIGTSTIREGFDEFQLLIPSNAYSLGFDGRFRFGENNYELLTWSAISHVEGSKQSISRIQLSPGKYFQRPDAKHLKFDPERTTLTGFSSHISMAKVAGNWRGVVNFDSRSAGFEINDLGFVNDTDVMQTGVQFGYSQFQSGKYFRSLHLYLNSHSLYNFDGDRLESGGLVTVGMGFHNHWGLGGGMQHNIRGLDVNTMRGGPAVMNNPITIVWGNILSDRRKSINVVLSVNYRKEHNTGGTAATIFPNLEMRPSSWISLRTGTRFHWRTNPWQWVGTALLSNQEREYVVGKLDQNIFALDFRVTITPIPDLNIDLYLQPLANQNNFSDYRYLNDPRNSDFDKRFVKIDENNVAKQNGTIEFTKDGLETYILQEPDFASVSLRGNAVIRWEFRPGSEIFLVWQQSRNTFGSLFDDFSPGGIYNRMFDTSPQNNILFKVTYWFDK